MKTTLWIKKKMTVFAGGDPTKGQNPEITIEIDNPQILVDPDKGHIIVLETK